MPKTKIRILLSDENGIPIKSVLMELSVDEQPVNIDKETNLFLDLGNIKTYIEPVGVKEKNINSLDRIDHILYDMGILHLNNGFFYLKHAVRLCLENKSYFSCVTKCLYPAIAKMYGTTAVAVERAIRNLIKICWEEHNAGEVYIETTGMPLSMIDIKPPTSAYIQLLVELYEKNYGAIKT